MLCECLGVCACFLNLEMSLLTAKEAVCYLMVYSSIEQSSRPGRPAHGCLTKSHMNRFHKMYKKRAIADAHGQLRGVPVGIAVTYRDKVVQYVIDHGDSLGIADALTTSNYTDKWKKRDLGDAEDFFEYGYTKRGDAEAFAKWGHYHVTGPEAAGLTYSAWLKGPMELCTAHIKPATHPMVALLVAKRLQAMYGGGLWDGMRDCIQKYLPRAGDPRLFEGPFTAKIPAPKPLSARKKPLVVLSIDLEEVDMHTCYHQMYVATNHFFDRRVEPSIDRGMISDDDFWLLSSEVSGEED